MTITSEFDPFSPQFGEKFAPPNLPVSVKDWAGNETNRVYADQWGTVQRHDVLDLGSESAEPDRLFAEHDGVLHERSRAPGAYRQPGSAVQPGLQPVLL